MTKWGFNSRITFLKNLGKKCRETCISRLNQRNVILEESRFTCFSLKNIRELHNSRRERLNSRWLNYMGWTLDVCCLDSWLDLLSLSVISFGVMPATLPDEAERENVLKILLFQRFSISPPTPICRHEALLAVCFWYLRTWVIGRGPRQKNGKILTELSFFAVFNHKNDLEKVWKSRNEFKLVGFKVEKNGPCSRENEVKISKFSFI